MAKDPSILFYFNDWHGGTITMSRFLKGCYMDLLHAQYNVGHLSLDAIKTVLGSDFGSSWPALQKKFTQDNEGLYYNKRLLFEVTKAKETSERQRRNVLGRYQTDEVVATKKKPPVLCINNSSLEDRRLLFENTVRENKGEYEGEMIEDFIRYWGESNGKKMRWEMHKTFEIPRRLSTWKKRSEEWKKPKVSESKPESKIDKIIEAGQGAVDYFLNKKQA